MLEKSKSSINVIGFHQIKCKCFLCFCCCLFLYFFLWCKRKMLLLEALCFEINLNEEGSKWFENATKNQQMYVVENGTFYNESKMKRLQKRFIVLKLLHSIFISKTIGPIVIKLGRNDHWMDFYKVNVFCFILCFIQKSWWPPQCKQESPKCQ